MEKRIGVVAIIITDRERVAPQVNSILSSYADVIVGRLGVPYRERGVAVIALIVDGDSDTIGAMTGKLGSLPGVKVRAALAGELD
ncbi:MAG: iron-only hydrogenase system regulator [Clostridia bacterium]|nr:iron-only hydrogenase system regulator [Clostridia bacterium]MDH7573161.1 iron-only hydrogenase system regulator [Clostridia bacterium]